MKGIILVILSGILFLPLSSLRDVKTDTIAAGEQPQIAADNQGIVRVVFGNDDKIFCATSGDKGATFSKPVLVAQIPNMHLGMSRGPQLASSAIYSVITAMDKSGNIHWFRLNNLSGGWRPMGILNDLKGSAPEGLMSIAADEKDNFYAAWLDTRTDKNNQVYFSSLSSKTVSWSKNNLVYRSSDGHVCECCKPGIAVNGPSIAIMFRNWQNGSRDLYFIKSPDGGKSFSEAQKLGTGTWKLNGCPMDGGGIVINAANAIETTWQRKGIVYYSEPGKPETYIGKGRTCSIAGNGSNAIITYQSNDTVKMMRPQNKSAAAIGTGGFLKSILIPGNKVIFVWEQNHKIKFRKV